MKRRPAKDLLTDPALRARIAAAVSGAQLEAVAAGTMPAPIVIHVVEQMRPPYWERPWFALLFLAIGAGVGAYVLQLS